MLTHFFGEKKHSFKELGSGDKSGIWILWNRIMEMLAKGLEFKLPLNPFYWNKPVYNIFIKQIYRKPFTIWFNYLCFQNNNFNIHLAIVSSPQYCCKNLFIERQSCREYSFRVTQNQKCVFGKLQNICFYESCLDNIP